MDTSSRVSNVFLAFAQEAPKHHKAWMDAVVQLDSACALDKKTEALAYIAVMAVMRLESGIPFHVKHAKSLGATREEIISAILVGLPAAGNVVVSSLPAALQAFDDKQHS